MTNNINRKSSAAELLSRQLAATVGEKPKAIADSFGQAVGRRLESRRITPVPGLPAEAQPQWYDQAIEHLRRNQAIEAEREAHRQAEEEARNAPQTAAGVASAAIAGQRDPSTPIPLNGAAVLRAALSSLGDSGTINGDGGVSRE
ncbi:hypothetical protein [Mycobacterium sp. DL592]|uniref:hypothetical protein n=1 Tax=Mycobacterium sp. DL592 TaxID=2675524 RepID=UPI001422AAAE|nr:hypothetical protein [Mycobacterium sp. DL592]